MAEPVSISIRAGLGIAGIMARRGVDAAAVGAMLGVTLPLSPRAASSDEGATLVGTGPGAWLLLKEGAPPDFGDLLQDRLRGLASVSDQSSAYLVTRLSGDGARRILQRGLPIDLHPDSFGPGSAATSMIAHIGVILWQVDLQPSYDVATFRSFGASFAEWLGAAVAAL